MKDVKAKVAEGIAAGMTNKQIAEELGIHRNSVSHHKKDVRSDIRLRFKDAVDEYRADVVLKLAEIEALVADPSVDKVDKAKVLLDVVKQLRAIYGTDAPTKSVSASFSASSDPLYLDFKKATSGLGESQVGDVLRYASSLPRESEPIDATWFPKGEEKSDDPA